MHFCNQSRCKACMRRKIKLADGLQLVKHKTRTTVFKFKNAVLFKILLNSDTLVLVLYSTLYLLYSSGPMVYGTCFSPVSLKEKFNGMGFAGRSLD